MKRITFRDKINNLSVIGNYLHSCHSCHEAIRTRATQQTGLLVKSVNQFRRVMENMVILLNECISNHLSTWSRRRTCSLRGHSCQKLMNSMLERDPTCTHTLWKIENSTTELSAFWCIIV